MQSSIISYWTAGAMTAASVGLTVYGAFQPYLEEKCFMIHGTGEIALTGYSSDLVDTIDKAAKDKCDGYTDGVNDCAEFLTKAINFGTSLLGWQQAGQVRIHDESEMPDCLQDQINSIVKDRTFVGGYELAFCLAVAATLTAGVGAYKAGHIQRAATAIKDWFCSSSTGACEDVDLNKGLLYGTREAGV